MRIEFPPLQAIVMGGAIWFAAVMDGKLDAVWLLSEARQFTEELIIDILRFLI